MQLHNMKLKRCHSLSFFLSITHTISQTRTFGHKGEPKTESGIILLTVLDVRGTYLSYMNIQFVYVC